MNDGEYTIKRKAIMTKLAILNFCLGEVLILSVPDEHLAVLENKYDDNTEDWLTSEGYDEKYGFNTGSIQYMWLEDDSEIREETIT